MIISTLSSWVYLDIRSTLVECDMGGGNSATEVTVLLSSIWLL